jgi:hypothetical protein
MTDTAVVDTAVVERILTGIADPTRRQILDVLVGAGSGTATTVAAALPVSRQAVVNTSRSWTAPAWSPAADEEIPHSPPLSTYSAPGVLRQDPGRVAESPAEAGTCGNQDARSTCAPVDV